MGLLGGIGKLLGKVAKAGLSVATRGLSDKVLSVAKTLGAQKKMARARTLANQTMAAKFLPPRVVATESSTVSALERAAAGGATYGAYGRYSPGSSRRTRRARRASKPAREFSIPSKKTKGKRQFSAKQLAAQQRFAEMARARAAAKGGTT